MTDGLNDGLILGGRDGLFVGALVGLRVGSVGAADGLNDGLNVGSLVGWEVGPGTKTTTSCAGILDNNRVRERTYRDNGLGHSRS